MKRLLCYAHFDANGQVRPFVKHALQAMSGLCADTIFISNSPLTDGDRNELSTLCSRVLVNNNTGYDFYMWKLGLEAADLSGYDEVVLMNSSVYGPLFNMEDVFNRMDKLDCDFWGITECFQMQPHIQSYFLVFHKNVVSSLAFLNFWGGILPYENKLQVIQSYEVGLTQWLVESGFKPGVLCPLEQLGNYCRKKGKRVRKKDNASVKHAAELLHIGNPFLKRDAVRNRKVDMTAVMPFLQRYGYPEHLINEHSQQKTLKCPLCNSPGKLAYKGVRDFQNLHDNNRYDYCRCSSAACGVLWRTDANVIEPASAVAPVRKEQPALNDAILPSALKRLSPGTILEIGCGTGERLLKLREQGWDVTGHAEDTATAERLSSLNIRFMQQPASDASTESGLFDCILVTQGLEQTIDPQAFLAGCHRMLKQGGLLLLRTPNANSLLLRIFQTYWFGFNAPRHLIIHTSRSLKRVLKSTGFEVTSLKTSSINSNIFALHSIDALLNKWTARSSTPRLGNAFALLPIQFFGSILNFITRKHGDECIVLTSRPTVFVAAHSVNCVKTTQLKV